ncbi:hypothetical protein REPUB_Repub16aG0087000 [Reevesia pubescens]
MKNEESNKPCYEDFEPYCKWKKESETSIIKQPDTLEIQLHGFKKEELKYEIGKDGFLYISGEHPVGKNLIKRFKKKFDVSEYDIKEIEATFEGGNILLRLPRKSSAISFPNIGNEKVGILLLGKKGFKKTMTSFVMAIALLLILAFYMYKYSECTNFQNWFK